MLQTQILLVDPLFSRTTRVAALVLVLLGCAESSSPKKAHPEGFETLGLRYEGSANNVTYPELAEDLGYLAPVKLKYIGNNATGGPHSIQTVVTGDTDFGSSFNGAVIKLVAAGAPISDLPPSPDARALVLTPSEASRPRP